jgi:hypothetical protein
MDKALMLKDGLLGIACSCLFVLLFSLICYLDSVIGEVGYWFTLPAAESFFNCVFAPSS